MRILVTGGAGFIGSHIVDAALAAGHSVSVVDNLSPHGGGRMENLSDQARFYTVDITDRAALEDVFERERPEVVYHEAAQASVKVSTDDPIYDAQVNILGLITVLQNCVRAGTRKVLFASSAAIFGTVEHPPVTLETPTRPESPYGITKMTAEHYLRYWKAAFGLEYTALRYSNVYGPRQDPHGEAGVIAIFTQRILNGEGVRIDWDGGQAKDYVYVEDVARVNLLALERGDGMELLVGTGIPTPVNDLYRQITALVGHEVPITHAPRRPGDVYLSYFDISRTEQELDWRPRVDLVTGLRATVDYFRGKQG